jgi:hypothetical protein
MNLAAKDAYQLLEIDDFPIPHHFDQVRLLRKNIEGFLRVKVYKFLLSLLFLQLLIVNYEIDASLRTREASSGDA